MITETRQSRTRLLQYYERRSRRRHHTLDNATLDKFNFICVPLRLDERHLEPSSSQTNLNVTSSKDIKICKPIEISSPTRRVRFQFDKNDKHERNFHSTDDERSPKKYSTHRVEFQIPLNKEINPWLNIDSPSPSAKVRSITSQKIDINHNNINNTIHPPSMTSYINLPSTDDPDRTRSQWYKEMYCHIHKPSEHKKDNLDVILVKLPLTPSRYREYHQKRDEQSNPYKPTYTFPDEFNGDLDRMEEYIRKTASHKSDSDRKNFSSSPIRMQTANVNDYPTNTKRNPEKITRFSDQLTFSSTSPTIERAKPINVTIASPVTVSSRSNTTHPIQPTSTTTTTTTDDEQKLMYKRVLRGGDIPATGLQKCLPHNREKSFEQVNESNKRNDHDVLESRVNESQPIYTAVALYNFQAQSNRELSFKKGETILVKRRINDDWLEGEHHGLTGIFPLNYVELFPYESNEHDNENGNGEGIVKYDYNPQTSLELHLKKGEKVILLRKLDQNWYEGRVNHIEGIFPGDYVEIITEPKDDLSKPIEIPTNVSKTPKSVLKNSTGSKTVSDFTVPMQKCQVLYDYTPQNVDELEIHVGDIINILEKCDDGWFCGIMENCVHGNNMKFGTFPGNYVKILPS